MDSPTGAVSWQDSLPSDVTASLESLVRTAADCFGSDLVSLVLYGSASEGRLRPTSDVNLLFVLKKYDARRVDPFREPIRTAYAAVNARAMFVLESELADAVEDFAVKFGDIANRRTVLHGTDPLAGLKPTRDASLRRLRQTLLNAVIRLRERYALVSLREEQLPLVIAEFAGPLRASAAAILELQGKPALPPREALVSLLATLGDGDSFTPLLSRISEARESQSLPPGTAAETLLRLSELAERLHVLSRQLV
jgi:predicted nucleotidyltransferase